MASDQPYFSRKKKEKKHGQNKNTCNNQSCHDRSISEEDDEYAETREAIVKEFHNPDCSYKVIIANPFAVAESISLHKACHNAIYLERSFNAAHFLQSKDRIHRYGLKQDVVTNYYYLVSEDSVDTTIHERLNEKERRLLDIIESMPIPLFDNYMNADEDDDIKAVLRDYVSNRRLSQVISADYIRWKYLSQSAVNEVKAFYIGWHRRLSRAYFSSAMAGLK